MAEKMSFEHALEQLEKFADQMSMQEVTLEESIRLYAESVKLAAFCQKAIDKAKLKVEMLETDDTQSVPHA